MRMALLMIAAFVTGVLLTPAHAIDLRDCSSYKDPGPRMECLERNTATLGAALETLASDYKMTVRRLEEKIASMQTAAGRHDVVNIASNGLERRCLQDDRNGGLRLDSCSSSSGWRLVPR
jgi:hypothetical protein